MKLSQSTIKTALAGIVVSKAQKQPLTHTTQKTLKKSLATIAKSIAMRYNIRQKCWKRLASLLDSLKEILAFMRDLPRNYREHSQKAKCEYFSIWAYICENIHSICKSIDNPRNADEICHSTKHPRNQSVIQHCHQV